MKIFLTGATGLLGGELLINLSGKKEIKKIYCLVRADSIENALIRIKRVFGLHHDFFDAEKIIPVVGNLTDETLPLSLEHNPLLKDIDVIIHSAASTSFSRMHNAVVEDVNINGLNHILSWSKTLKNLRTFLYIGTATICGEDINHRVIKEDESPNLNSKHFVKYTYTKMLGELAIRKELPEEKILIVRPSIIMGDSRPIFPRSPVILWTVATSNLLRLLPVNQHANLDIVPVDYATNAITELLFAKRHYSVYHVSAGEHSATNTDKLAKAIADYYPERPDFKFVDKKLLSQMKKWSKKILHSESQLYEYAEYLDYWLTTFGTDGKLRILLAGMEEYLKFMELGQLFDNSRLLRDTNVGNSIPAHIYIKDSVHFLEKIDVFEGALDP